MVREQDRSRKERGKDWGTTKTRLQERERDTKSGEEKVNVTMKLVLHPDPSKLPCQGPPTRSGDISVLRYIMIFRNPEGMIFSTVKNTDYE